MTSMIRSSSAVTSHPENDATRQNGEWEQEKILFTDSFLHTQDTQDTDTHTLLSPLHQQCNRTTWVNLG